MDPDALLALFDRTVGAVRTALASADLRARGDRDGQYALDLATDAAALSVLLGSGVGVLSEESGLHRGDADVVVVLDPVDGSTNCSRGIPWYATSLAAVDGDGPLAAMVANLATGVTYTAVRRRGAWRDGVPIRTSGCEAVGQAMVALNGWSPRHIGWAQYRALGSTALDSCLVAEGVLDGFVDFAGQNAPWDYLGAMLVVLEAGGAVLEANGAELVELDHDVRRAPVLAATPGLAEELVARRNGAVDWFLAELEGRS